MATSLLFPFATKQFAQQFVVLGLMENSFKEIASGKIIKYGIFTYSIQERVLHSEIFSRLSFQTYPL